MTQSKNINVPGKKTLSTYILGYVLCLILTIIPFVMVGKALLHRRELYITLILFAILQLFVQVTFFIRLNTSPKGRLDVMAFLFTILIILVVVVGSLWIMYNLNVNMMIV